MEIKGTTKNIDLPRDAESPTLKILENMVTWISSISTSLKIPDYTLFTLLVLQAGCQPILTKLFMPDEIVRTTAVLAQECSKFILSFLILASTGDWRESIQDWSLYSSLTAAGTPAALFVVQNYCNLMANQVLPPVAFVVLNQTKALSTAWCCFILLGQKQSDTQVLALLLLVCSALVVQAKIPVCKTTSDESELNEPALLDETQNDEEEEPASNEIESDEELRALLDQTEPLSQSSESPTSAAAEEWAERQLIMGVMPALCASFISGLAGALVQRTLQAHQRNPHIFNMELAIFSCMVLLTSLVAGSPDFEKLKNNGISQGWTLGTWVPVVSNGLGGILVGLVTKYHGSVVKSFAMIFGMVISGILQQACFARRGGGVTIEQITGALLGATSLYLHAKYPP